MVIHFREGHPFTDEQVVLFLKWFSHASPVNLNEPEFIGWECPACGVGVRGDVEVCPNCVKNKTEFATKEDLAGRPRVITELSRLRSLGLADESGYLTDEAMKSYDIDAVKGVDTSLKERLRNKGNPSV
jgi:hypothetical protein